MLNEKGNRELAYIVRVDSKEEIIGYDRICSYNVLGWKCIAGKYDFQPGDLAVYIEIDSLCPYNEEFSFLDKVVDEEGKTVRPDRHKIKTQKFAKGQYLSQGLLCPLSMSDKLKDAKLGDFVTEKLGITYYEKEDNTRKADVSRYTSMKARHKKFFKTKLGKWLMRREWGRKLCFFFMGKKKDKKTDWPNWVVKTDEERCQNCFNQMKALNVTWMATEKIDGTSTTFTEKNGKKRELLVCSRNVVFNTPEKEERNYYKDSDGNVYLEMAHKYNIKAIVDRILDEHKNWLFVTIQGETYGGNIQKRNYGPEHRLAIFNVIYQENGKAPVRMNPLDMLKFIEEVNKWNLCENKLECVPLVDPEFELPETCDELLEYAGSELSRIDHQMREGVVFRTVDGVHSFKAVDNSFLLKYHAN